MKPNYQFEDLPAKLILKVFSYLSYEDLFVNCRRVDKNFNSIICKYFKLKDGLLISHCKLPINQSWFQNDLLDSTNQFKTKDYSLITIDSEIFSQVRHLMIISTFYSSYEVKNLTNLFKQLNKLTQLEHLEIIGLKIEQSNILELNLSKLVVLNIERVELGQLIILNTPNLAYLKIELFESYQEKIKFKYPQSIKLLITNYFEKCTTTFSNLEYLYVCQKLIVEDIKNEEEKNGSFLYKLPKLKEIQFYEETQTYDYLLLQKETYNRCGLKICYCGVNLINNDLTKVPKIDTSPYYNLNSISIQFYLQFHNETATILPFAKRLVYENLDHLINEIPEALMNKFVNLKFIEVKNKVKDVNLLVDFLKSFRSLKSLSFKNTNLNQEFFDFLPTAIQPNLDSLEIDEEDIDFEFVLNFKNLNNLSLYKNLEYYFVCNIFEKFGELKLYFFMHDIDLSIVVDYNRSCELSIENKRPIQFDSEKELFEYFSMIDFDDLYVLQSDHSFEDYLDHFNPDLESDVDINL